MTTLILFPSEGALAQKTLEQIQTSLEKRIRFAQQHERFICGGEYIYDSSLLAGFYNDQHYSPSWFTENGLKNEVKTLINTIKEAELDGLNPDDYHLTAIEALLPELQTGIETNTHTSIEKRVDLDLLLTDAFLMLACHLSEGLINPETIESEWLIKPRKETVINVLQLAIATGQIEDALETVRQKNPGYQKLKKAYIQYRHIEQGGGWPQLTLWRTTKKGDEGIMVSRLWSRLAQTGDIIPTELENTCFFGNVMENAVMRFQHRNALKEDGVVGPETLAALNVPITQRVNQLKLNLERWRWLPHDFGDRYLLVNIADFMLHVMENNVSLMNMRVVVGKKYRRTPVFTGKMTYMVINPYWNIPHKLAKEDFLPRIRKNPDILNKLGIKVYESWKEGAGEINADTIDWKRITDKTFSYKLRQNPGTVNALGQIKFMFPNKFSVYLHDTPSKNLFDKTTRSLSSGCIRIAKPVDLAEYLLKKDLTWTRKKILNALDSMQAQVVTIPDPINIHILYLTAWVDENDLVHFRNDIYDRDMVLDNALKTRSHTK